MDIKIPTAQAIYLASAMMAEPGMIRAIHTETGKGIDNVIENFQEETTLKSLTEALISTGLEVSHKLEDTRLIKPEEIENGKILHSTLAELTSTATAEDLEKIHNGFSLMNEMHEEETLGYTGIRENVEHENIQTRDNSFETALYNSITQSTEFLQVKYDKNLTLEKRKENISTIASEFLKPETLNYVIENVGNRKIEIEKSRETEVDPDVVIENTTILRQQIAFLNKFAESGGTTDELLANVDQCNKEAARLANNSMEESTKIEEKLKGELDGAMENAHEQPVSQGYENGKEKRKENEL